MPCTDCGQPKVADTRPVFWESVRVWFWQDGAWLMLDCYNEWQFESLPNAILGAVGYRSNGTTDYVSGYDWYGWYKFPDGTWRVSGHTGDKTENTRQAQRYDAIWREGILVSDAVMDEVSAAMVAYIEGLNA